MLTDMVNVIIQLSEPQNIFDTTDIFGHFIINPFLFPPYFEEAEIEVNWHGECRCSRDSKTVDATPISFIWYYFNVIPFHLNPRGAPLPCR